MVFVLSGPLLTFWLSSVSVAGGETMAISLDILKAFDKVWHIGFCHNLKVYGVDGYIISILESFLQERSLKVVLDGLSSPLCITNAGVPQ